MLIFGIIINVAVDEPATACRRKDMEDKLNDIFGESDN